MEYSKFRTGATVMSSPRPEKGRGVEEDQTDGLQPDNRIQKAGSKYKRHKEEMHQTSKPD